MAILFVPQVRSWFGTTDETVLKTAVFATFMMAITFNGFNARTAHCNPFYGIGKNRNFIFVMLSIILIQFVFVTFGGEVLSVTPLAAEQWGICFLLAAAG